MKKGIWITWEKQRRNIGISSALGWPLYEIVMDNRRLSRYAKSSIRTLAAIIGERPKFVAAQNPSIVLAFFVILLKRFFGYKVIIDAHYCGIYPLEGCCNLLMALSNWLQKKADLTLVTNEKMAAVVTMNKGNAFVLTDRIPSTPFIKKSRMGREFNIAYICTFAKDEPFDEVISAADKLDRGVFVYVTGKYPDDVASGSLPRNVKLVGYLSDIDYWSLLLSVDAIMDLTLRQDCLVCGAYEGVAVEKPLILSDTAALRAHFDKGCVYVLPSSDSIEAGIQTAIRERDILNSEISVLKKSLIQQWSVQLSGLQKRINSELGQL
jgi:hypothetical protein